MEFVHCHNAKMASSNNELENHFASFFDSLFETEAVATTIASLVASAQEYIRDPLHYVMLKCLTEALSLTLFDNTCVLFRSDSSVAIKYRGMSPLQLQALHRLLKIAHQHDAVNSVQQRGGAIGVVVRFPPCLVLYAPQDHVLAGLQRLLSTSTLPQRDHVTNVVVQRLLASSQIAPGQLTRARKIVERWEDEGKASERSAGKRKLED